MSENQSQETNHVTIDELGLWIKNGFAEVKTDIRELDERLSTRIDKLDEKFSFRIDGLEKTMNDGFTGVQSQINDIRLNYVRYGEYELLKGRVTRIEGKVGIRNT